MEVQPDIVQIQSVLDEYVASLLEREGALLRVLQLDSSSQVVRFGFGGSYAGKPAARSLCEMLIIPLLVKEGVLGTQWTYDIEPLLD